MNDKKKQNGKRQNNFRNNLVFDLFVINFSQKVLVMHTKTSQKITFMNISSVNIKNLFNLLGGNTGKKSFGFDFVIKTFQFFRIYLLTS